MAKTKIKEIIEKVLISPVFISLMVFLLATLVVYRLTTTKVDSAYDRQFIRDVLVEAHGMLFDILIIGTFIFALHTVVESKTEKKRNIRRWQEEIDDFRRWDEKEATFRIVGNIKRLNRNGIIKIDLSACFLKEAVLDRLDFREINLSGVNFEEAYLIEANFEGTDLSVAYLRKANLSYANLEWADLLYTDLEGARLIEANFDRADLEEANFEGADLLLANLDGAYLWGAYLRGAKNLTIEQLSKVYTLYKAELDPLLEKQIKEKYPHLLEDPGEWWHRSSPGS